MLTTRPLRLTTTLCTWVFDPSTLLMTTPTAWSPTPLTVRPEAM